MSGTESNTRRNCGAASRVVVPVMCMSACVFVVAVAILKPAESTPEMTSHNHAPHVRHEGSETNARSDEVDSQVELVSRMKRRAEDKPERKIRRNKKGGKEKKRKEHKAGKISAVHIVVNKNHPLVIGKPLATGPRGKLIPYWKLADEGFSKQQKIAQLQNDGSIQIKRSGLYMIYSQMTYFDRTGRWSHLVAVNEKPFIKCLASEWGIETDPDTNAVYNTIHQCYTSAVTALRKGDTVGIYSMYPERVMHEDKEMCFWGLVKLN